MLLKNTGSMNTILERPNPTQASNDHAILSSFFKRIHIACSSVFWSFTGRRVEYKKQKTIAKITTRASVMMQNSSMCCSSGDLAGHMAFTNSANSGTVVLVHMLFQLSVNDDGKVIVRGMSSVRQTFLNTRSNNNKYEATFDLIKRKKC